MDKDEWHIYTMEYYSAIERNETELFVVRWMDLEGTVISAVSQTGKDKYHMISFICESKKQTTKKNKPNKTETDSQIQRTDGC